MLKQLDQNLFLYLNKNWHNAFFDKFFVVITDPRHAIPHFDLWLAGILLGFLFLGKPKQRKLVLLLIATLIVGEGINQVIKEWACRIRPFWVLENVRLLVGSSASYSFPSAHATNISAAATLISYEYRNKKWVILLCSIFAVLVCYSRIYVGVHYPMDVLFGMLLGISTAYGMMKLNQRYPLFKPDEHQKIRLSYFGFFIFIMLISTIFRLSYISFPSHSLSSEEAQYWDWSRHLDWSYYSKPPMIAYIIRFFTTLLGTSAFSVRVGSVVISVIMGLMTYYFTKKLFNSKLIAINTLMLVNFIPIFSAGSILMTTDTPVLLFWSAAIYMLYYTLFENKKYGWYYSGILFGLGMLSKYNMVFLIPCIFLFLVSSNQYRFWLKRKEPYISCIIGFIFFLSVLVWNYQYNWVSFKHVSGQAGLPAGLVYNPMEFLKFLGSQIGILSPFVFLALIVALYRMIRNKSMFHDDKKKFLMYTSVPVLILFLIKSFQGKVEANWADNAYYTWVILAVGEFSQWYGELQSLRSKLYFKSFVGTGFAMALFLSAFMHDSNVVRIFHIPLNPEVDPTYRIIGWEQLGDKISDMKSNMRFPDHTFVFSDKYQITSELGFYVQGRPPSYCANFGRRMNQYDIWSGLDGKPKLTKLSEDTSLKNNINLQSILNLENRIEPKQNQEMHPISTSAFEFSNALDTGILSCQLPSDGGLVKASIQQCNSMSDSSGNSSDGGILQINLSTPTSAIKITGAFPTWMHNVPEKQYTLRLRIFGTNTSNVFQQSLYNGDPGQTPIDIQVSSKYSIPRNWQYLDIPFISQGDTKQSKGMYPQIILMANGSPGTVYIDGIKIFEGTPVFQGTSQYVNLGKLGWDGIFVTYGDDLPYSVLFHWSFNKVDPPETIQVFKGKIVYNQFHVYRCYGFHGQLFGEVDSKDL